MEIVLQYLPLVGDPARQTALRSSQKADHSVGVVVNSTVPISTKQAESLLLSEFLSFMLPVIPVHLGVTSRQRRIDKHE